MVSAYRQPASAAAQAQTKNNKILWLTPFPTNSLIRATEFRICGVMPNGGL
jgi:hypothetical protein